MAVLTLSGERTVRLRVAPEEEIDTELTPFKSKDEVQKQLKKVADDHGNTIQFTVGPGDGYILRGWARYCFTHEVDVGEGERLCVVLRDEAFDFDRDKD